VSRSALPNRRWIAVAVVLGTLAGTFARAATAPPKPTNLSYLYDAFDNSFPRPVARQLDPARWVRKIGHNPREAANVDENDQVRLPSTWWQPRVGFVPVTAEQMLAGPGPGHGPAPGRWQVTKAKTQGVTPGFFVKDASGKTFILKFDPPDHPEMASSADVIVSHLFWAAGYNVPDNAIVTFRAESLDVAPNASVTDASGRKQPMSREDLTRILGRVRPQPDGSYRAMSSRLLGGKNLGPFLYEGRRRDDPEDLIPHECRRELRGMWPMAAWLNHSDVRCANTLDMWVTEGGRSFVRHHLIDFGACIGSGSTAAHDYATGTEYYMDYSVATEQAVTLGLKSFAWESAVDPKLPTVGFIDADHFDPKTWRPDYPNPAFDERTDRDVRWGARIVTGFSDDMIRAAVGAGMLSDPRAADYLTGVLIQRRDLIAHAWSTAASVAVTPYHP